MSTIMDKCEVGVFNYYSKIDIYTIINYLKVYAELKQYKLDKNVQIVICSLHNNNNYISISDEDKEKAKTGNLFVKVKDTRFNICSDFDYNKDARNRKQYINLYENFAINVEYRNCRGVFSVYFKNIPHAKKSNGYLNRVHMLIRANIDTFPKALSINYVISMIQEILKSNNNIVEKAKNIDVYMPYLSYNIKINNFIKSIGEIDEGVDYIVNGITYIFHVDDNLPECFYYPDDKKRSDSLMRDFNSIHIEVMRYNAIYPILESEFEFYFN